MSYNEDKMEQKITQTVENIAGHNDMDDVFKGESLRMLLVISKLISTQWCVKDKKTGLNYHVQHMYSESPYYNEPTAMLECRNFKQEYSDYGSFWHCSLNSECEVYEKYKEETDHISGGAYGACHIDIDVINVFNDFIEVYK